MRWIVLLLLATPVLAQPAPADPTAPPAQPAPAAQPPAPAQPTPVLQEPIAAGEATSILGRAVLGRPNPDAPERTVARVIDVLVDQDGQARAAVLEFGGFMGVGKRRVAVAWRALRFSPADQRITLELDAAAIAAMPEWKPGPGPVMLATPP